MISYPKSVFPDKWRCTGLPLVTHSLGHSMLLSRLENPLAGRPPAGPRVVGRGDLLQALMICTRDWRRAVAMLDTPWEKAWLSWRSIRLQERGMEGALVEIHAYLLSAWPEIDWWSPTAGHTRSLGADLLQSLIGQQRSTGLTLQEALDVPVAIALWDLAAAAEKDGAISICGDKDKAILDRYDRLVESGRLPVPGQKVDRKRN